jgi:hypothetical protein
LDGSALRVLFEEAHEPFDRFARVDNRIVVEEKDVPAIAEGEGPVVSAGESGITADASKFSSPR